MDYQFDLKDVYPDGTSFFPNNDSKVFDKVKHCEIIFNKWESSLWQKVTQYDATFGVMAWVKHSGIIKTLSQTNTCLLIQKEELTDKVIAQYEKLNNKYKFMNLPDLLQYKEIDSNESMLHRKIETIRMVGVQPEDTHFYPRCHDKFVVFYKEITKGAVTFLKPKAVWVGSFNFTYNATKGFDTVLYIANDHVAKHFHDKFVRIYGISEQLSPIINEDICMEFEIAEKESYKNIRKSISTEMQDEQICTMTNRSWLRKVFDFIKIDIGKCSNKNMICPECKGVFCTNHCKPVEQWIINAKGSPPDYAMCLKCAMKFNKGRFAQINPDAVKYS